MRIQHITGIYGDTETLKRAIEFASGNDVDVIACTGDLLTPILTLDELKIIESTGDQGLVSKFDEGANKQYETLSKLFKSAKRDVVIIPGVWDSQQFNNYFNGMKLHLDSWGIGGPIFAGFGSRDRVPDFAPQDMRIPFSSEYLYHFLLDKKPNVALTYVPPYGYCDMRRVEGVFKLTGNFACLSYMLSGKPELILCGKRCDNPGLMKNLQTNTIIVNSGNLWKREDLEDSGNFSLIDIADGSKVKFVSFYQIRGSQTKLMNQVDLEDGGGE